MCLKLVLGWLEEVWDLFQSTYHGQKRITDSGASPVRGLNVLIRIRRHPIQLLAYSGWYMTEFYRFHVTKIGSPSVWPESCHDQHITLISSQSIRRVNQNTKCLTMVVGGWLKFRDGYSLWMPPEMLSNNRAFQLSFSEELLLTTFSCETVSTKVRERIRMGSALHDVYRSAVTNLR